MTLRARLIFGTSRLAGGGCAAASRRLIEDCLAAGIAAFDTAPSYGMGAAEALLGEVAGDAAGVRLHSKVGSIKPAHPELLGWGKRLRGLVAGTRGSSEAQLEAYAGPAAACDYGLSSMQASLERSCAMLRRETLDLLLLHEAEPMDLPAPASGFLESVVRQGRARSVGFAHFGPVRRAGAGLVCQVAPWPADFAGRGDGDGRIFHSIRHAGRFAAARDPVVAARIAAQANGNAGLFAGGDAAFWGALLLLARAWPEAQLIFATTDRTRLAAFLATVRRVDEVGLTVRDPGAGTP